MSETDPIDILLHEHLIIKRAASLALKAESLLPAGTELYDKTIRLLLHFFREYADKFHHYKEESILFPDINIKNETVGQLLVSEMVNHHIEFRQMIRETEDLLNDRKYPDVCISLQNYTSLLLDHIAAEDEEVFQVGSTLLNPEENRRMYYKFLDVDRELGEDKKLELEESLNKIEGIISQ